MREIIEKCKCGVYLTVNEHKDVYQSAEDFIKEEHEDMEDVPEDVKKKMIEEDIIMSLQFYPNTPIGFFKIWHWNYYELVKEAKKVLFGGGN